MAFPVQNTDVVDAGGLSKIHVEPDREIVSGMGQISRISIYCAASVILSGNYRHHAREFTESDIGRRNLKV